MEETEAKEVLPELPEIPEEFPAPERVLEVTQTMREHLERLARLRRETEAKSATLRIG